MVYQQIHQHPCQQFLTSAVLEFKPESLVLNLINLELEVAVLESEIAAPGFEVAAPRHKAVEHCSYRGFDTQGVASSCMCWCDSVRNQMYPAR
jgi:hypothetical protein